VHVAFHQKCIAVDLVKAISLQLLVPQKMKAGMRILWGCVNFIRCSL